MRSQVDQGVDGQKLTLCHRASVVLHVKGRNAGEGFQRERQARWGHGSDADVAEAPSTAGSACSGCSICGGSAHRHLADCLHDNDSAGLEVEPTGLPAVPSGWREVPLRDGDAEEAPLVGLPPLRVCAVVCGDGDNGSKGSKAGRLDLELRVVADPLALAQRARFAIYPPWRLGPHLRFSWRLEKRSREEALSPSMERTHGRDPGRRPRALTGIGGVSGGFGGVTSSSFDVDVYTELAHEKTQANASSRAFQLLSNTMDAEAEASGLLLPLRGHQLRSLAWMQACEAENREPLLLGVSREFFPTLHPPHAAQQLLCEALGCRAVARVQRAFHLRGGLLADQVGSGKTAVTLGLVASDGSRPEASSRRTLVLVPGRLLQQWQQEVRKFLPANAIELYLGVSDIPERGAVPQVLLSPVEILATAEKRPRMEASVDMDLGEMAHKLRAICLSGVDRIVVDEFHEILDSASSGRLLALQELWADCGEATSLWGLTGTPPLSDFASVARIAEAFKIDLQAFRRQLDAREMAQRMLDYVARANGSSALSGLDVHEELVSLYHTPAERAIYVQGVADAKRKHKQQKQMGHVDQPVCSDLLQLCSHFRLEEADVEADAERESASLLRTRADAVETARQWLLVSARRMEAEILSARRRGNGLPTLVAEQYAQLLAEVGGEPLSRSTEAVASQIAGASAARQSAGQGRRHERDADDLILRAITEVRDSSLASAASGSEVVSEGAPQNSGDSLELLVELLEEVKQAKEAFRQRSHDHAFLAAMLEAAEASRFCCPVCFSEAPPTERAILAACAHLFCLHCAGKLVRRGECALCRQSLRREPGLDEVLRVREPGAVQPGEREERQRWGRFGSKLFHVVRKLRDIAQEDPTARAIVFVQWASLRRKLAAAFAEFQVPYVCLEERFDASNNPVLHSFWERDDVVTSFQGAPLESTEGPKVLLLSLQDAASGTNLTRANHVLFVHPVFASCSRLAVAYETQALGRCLRVGQTKRVFLWRFVTLGTVEEELSYRHQAELWQRTPELLAKRAETQQARAVRSAEPEKALSDEDVDLDDLFWGHELSL